MINIENDLNIKCETEDSQIIKPNQIWVHKKAMKVAKYATHKILEVRIIEVSDNKKIKIVVSRTNNGTQVRSYSNFKNKFVKLYEVGIDKYNREQ